jgi:hypothetical protein
MTDKKARLRGVCDIPSRLNRPDVKSSKAQRANTLARLEHQKTLLERQLEVWRKQQVVTEQRLQMVRLQIRTVTQGLKLTRSAPKTVRRPTFGAGVAAPAEASPARRREIDVTF